MLESLKDDLNSYAEPSRTEVLKKYFKVFPGGYGEGDEFIGIRAPNLRIVTKNYYKSISLKELRELISSNIHEYRLAAVLILVLKYEKSKSEESRREVVGFYIEQIKFVNNWDLIDSSAHKILGIHLLNRETKLLFDFAYSDDLWLQRISIITTFQFIRNNKFDLTFDIAKILLHHDHDLIHKGVGWMLREVGNRNFKITFDFLKLHYTEMPRTMLRYAIEKFPEDLRQDFLKNRV